MVSAVWHNLTKEILRYDCGRNNSPITDVNCSTYCQIYNLAAPQIVATILLSLSFITAVILDFFIVVIFIRYRANLLKSNPINCYILALCLTDFIDAVVYCIPKGILTNCLFGWFSCTNQIGWFIWDAIHTALFGLSTDILCMMTVSRWYQLWTKNYGDSTATVGRNCLAAVCVNTIGPILRELSNLKCEFTAVMICYEVFVNGLFPSLITLLFAPLTSWEMCKIDRILTSTLNESGRQQLKRRRHSALLNVGLLLVYVALTVPYNIWEFLLWLQLINISTPVEKTFYPIAMVSATTKNLFLNPLIIILLGSKIRIKVKILVHDAVKVFTSAIHSIYHVLRPTVDEIPLATIAERVEQFED